MSVGLQSSCVVLPSRILLQARIRCNIPECFVFKDISRPALSTTLMTLEPQGGGGGGKKRLPRSLLIYYPQSFARIQ